MLAILRDGLLFCFVLTGCTSLGLAVRRRGASLEAFALGAGLGLVLDYLLLGGLYIAGIPLGWHAGLAAVGWLLPQGRSILLACLKDPAFRGHGARWLIFAGWLLGWQMLVYSYSGGAWAGDWQEHYDRAHFFLARWPTDYRFLDLYPLPARPPMANLLTAGLLALGGGAFGHYQVFCTLLGSLVYFPLALLVRRWDASEQACAILLGLLMLSPLVVQNATFPWTKLPCAFFILLAITQLAPAEDGRTMERLPAGLLALAAAVLVHYSAAPWSAGLLLAWLLQNRHVAREAAFWRQAIRAALGPVLLVATWLAWSWHVYGAQTTLASNTAVDFGATGDPGQRLIQTGFNLLHTLIPSFTSASDHPLLQQNSLMGQWRDNWFNLYQLNLPFSLGLTGAAVLVWQLHRESRTGKFPLFWWVALPVATVLGIASQGGPDTLGLTHITLQPLVLLGLARLAARTETLPRWLSYCWIASLTMDLALGIVLHFGVQSLWLDHWLQPALTPRQLIRNYTIPAVNNYIGKERLHLLYLADTVPVALPLILLLVTGGLAGWILIRQATRPVKPESAPVV